MSGLPGLDGICLPALASALGEVCKGHGTAVGGRGFLLATGMFVLQASGTKGQFLPGVVFAKGCEFLLPGGGCTRRGSYSAKGRVSAF